MKVAIERIKVNEGRRALRDCTDLANSIRELGLLTPIAVREDYTLIAGYHRLTACKQLGWSDIEAIVLPLDHLRTQLAEIDENLIRNELTVLERSVELGRRKEIYEAIYPLSKAKVAGAIASNKAQGKALDASEIISFASDTADKVGKSKRTVEQEVQIGASIADDVRDLIASTPIADNKTELIALARLPQNRQREIARKIVAVPTTSVKKEVQADKRKHDVKEAVDLAVVKQKFNVIYADPPWRYEFVPADNRAIENHYPTMELDDICKLPVHEIAADDCMLFLWATSPKLAEAMQVIEAWGFTYRTCAVWVKNQIGNGHYFRQRHELLLLAKRGELRSPEPANRPDSVIEAPRADHSAKPHEVYALIERMYPEYPKVELFSRNLRAGWKGWGNQHVNAA